MFSENCNMSQFILSVLLFTSIIFGGNILDNYDGRFESHYVLMDTTDISTSEESAKPEQIYPARSLLRSLIIPGWGQLDNKSPWWKPVLFAGVEIAGIAGWYKWNKKAEKLRLDYENFADEHWSLYSWITNTIILQDLLSDSLASLGYNWDPDVQIIGTHHLNIIYDKKMYSSDCFGIADYSSTQCYFSGYENYTPSLFNSWIDTFFVNNPDSISVISNRDYYENVGKYDQFVAGWEGILDNYIIKYKNVGDSTEIIISSPLKNDYLNQRENSNEYLNMATYAASAIMFNHVISALEAVWTSTRQSRKNKSVETSAKLIYDKHAQYGIGGISFSVIF